MEVSIGICVAGILELSPLMRKWGVKGFEDSFFQLDDDMVPIRLQDMNKSGIATTTEYGNQKQVVGF